ncbi:uncharacterized protein [Haliotis cracherodii]|uniref:uncharacterized protein n=1 Tax=Haliotis cracherodii TaxID=6455 RepID=UPI0039E7D340
MYKAVCTVSIVAFMFTNFLVEGYKLESRHKRQNQENSSTTPYDSSTTNTTVRVYTNNDSGRIGLVVGVIFGVLAGIAAFAIIVTIWIKNKRDRDSEYARAAKVQRNSALSAGVYNDLTTASPIVKVSIDQHKEGSEMESLKKEEEEE